MNNENGFTQTSIALDAALEALNTLRAEVYEFAMIRKLRDTELIRNMSASDLLKYAVELRRARS